MKQTKKFKRDQKKKRKAQFLIACFSSFFIIGFIFYYDFIGYLNLENFKNHKELLLHLANEKPLFLMLTLFVSYLSMAIVSLPGTMFFTMIAGFLFGFWKGILLVSVSLTLGCFICFLFFAVVLRPFVIKNMPERLNHLLEEINKDASYYLFAMRMIFIVPFIVPNFLMSLTHIKPRQFLWITYLSNFLITIFFVQAGLHISKINNIKDLISFRIILSLTFLGCLPILAKKILKMRAKKKDLNYKFLLKKQ